MVLGYLQRVPRALLAGALITMIAAVDWRVQANIAFGFLYILPMLIVGTVFPVLGVMLTALICTVLAFLGRHWSVLARSGQEPGARKETRDGCRD